MFDSNSTEMYSLICFISETMSETRKPKRILHFSDGVLEEYSSEEESDEKVGSQYLLGCSADLLRDVPSINLYLYSYRFM